MIILTEWSLYRFLLLLAITLEELAKNNGKDGAPTYIGVRNVVFDVSTSGKNSSE